MTDPIAMLLARVKGLVERGELAGVPNLAVRAFEQALGRTAHMAHAVTTPSGSQALELILEAAGVGPGHRVIVPALSSFGTLAAVARRGALPVVVDIDPWRLTIAPTAVADALDGTTRAVLAVHVMGIAPDIDALRVLIPDDVLLVEDASQGFPAQLGGDVAAVSLSGGKPIDLGEGGAILTDDTDLATAARWLTCLGHDGVPVDGSALDLEHGHHRMLGTSARMPALQAALGLYRMETLDRRVDSMRASCHLLREALSAAGMPLLAEPRVPLAVIVRGQLARRLPLERPLQVYAAHREPALRRHVELKATPVAEALESDVSVLATDGPRSELEATLAGIQSAGA